MRKILIFILLVTISELWAQARLARPEMYIGTAHGVTASMINFNPAVDQGYLLGYNGGLVFRYIAEKNVGTQLELNFSQRGWSEATGLYARRLNYLELPFMTHIYVGRKNRFFINIGPKISYLISQKTLTNNVSAPADQQVMEIENPFDYGLCGGLGLLFNIKGWIYQLDTRVNYSLSDIFPNAKTDYFQMSNNLNVSVNLAWMLRVK